MIELFFVGPAHDHFWRCRAPDGRVFPRLAEPAGIFLANVPTRLVLEPIVRSRQRSYCLSPDDLLMMHKADAKKAAKDLRCESRGVPHVSSLKTRHQLEGVRPIGNRVAGDGGLRVPLGPVLQVAGLGWPAAIQAGPDPARHHMEGRSP